MDRIIKIDGKDVKFRATARTPRLYRAIIGRDMIRDMNALSKAYTKSLTVREDMTEEEKRDAQLDATDLEIFENAAYIMARHATPDDIPDNPDDWLDGFGMFSIYKVLPELLKLWALNNKTTSEAKKKWRRGTGSPTAPSLCFDAPSSIYQRKTLMR